MVKLFLAESGMTLIARMVSLGSPEVRHAANGIAFSVDGRLLSVVSGLPFTAALGESVESGAALASLSVALSVTVLPSG